MHGEKITKSKFALLRHKAIIVTNRVRKNLFVNAFEKLLDDEGLEYAGYMAYLNIFSIFPLFITLIASLTILGQTEIGVKAVSYISELIPEYALKVIKPQLTQLLHGPSASVISFVFIGALWTTTSTLEGLRKIFNKMYGVTNPPFFFITRMMSIIEFLIAIVILLITITSFILIPSIISYIELKINYTIPSLEHRYLNKLYSVGILTIVIGGIYYSLTNKKIPFISVLPGAFTTIILWFVSGSALAYYMKNFQEFDVIYGSLSGAIIVLLFFYVVNIALLYGTEINVILWQRKNSRPDLASIAKKIKTAQLKTKL